MDTQQTKRQAEEEELAAIQHVGFQDISAIDYVLFALTLVPTGFLLQFATNPMMRVAQYPRPRRIAMGIILVLELVLLAYVIWLVAH